MGVYLRVRVQAAQFLQVLGHAREGEHQARTVADADVWRDQDRLEPLRVARRVRHAHNLLARQRVQHTRASTPWALTPPWFRR